MKITIQTPHVLARESLLVFVRGKVGKLENVSKSLIETSVTLKLDKTRTDENKICEIRGVIPGNDLFVQKRASSFEEAALRAVDVFRRLIVESKDKSGGEPVGA